MTLVKILLLHEVIRDDNSANNGEILIIYGSLITIIIFGSINMVQLLEDHNLIKTIPWEVVRYYIGLTP